MSKYFAILALFIVQFSFAQENYVYKTPRKNINKAYDHLVKEETKAAIEYFNKINPSDSLYDFAQLNVFISAYTGELYQESINACDLAIESGSAFESDAYFYKIKSLIKLKEYVKSDQEIKKALKRFPLMFPYDYLRAEMLFERKEYEQAKQLLETIVVSHPQHSESHALLANIYAKQSAETEAILAYQMAIISNRSSGVLRKSFIEMEDVMKNNFEVTDEKKDHKNFKQVNGLINAKMAVQNNYKASMPIRSYANNVSDLILNQLSFNASSTYFPMKYYGQFIQEVKKAGLEKGYILYMLKVLNDPTVIKYHTKYQSQVIQFNTLLDKFFKDQVNKNKFPINGEIEDRDYILNDKGRLIGVGEINEKNQSVGPITYYYPTGNVSAELNYNSEGQLQGKNVWYNKDGLIKETGEYENGKMNGEGSYARSNGVMVYEGEFLEGKLKGEAKIFYNNGLLHFIKNLEGKKTNGPVREFYQTGTLLAAYDVIDDEQDGLYVSFYPSGDTLIAQNYIQGKEEGSHVEYHPNGNFYSTGNYKDGLRVGNWKNYFYDGSLQSIYNYKSGKLNGSYIEFSPNGDTLIVSNYVNDLLSGEYKDYGKNNTLLWTHYFKKGKYKKFINYNEDGSVLREGKKDYVLNDRYGFKYIEATRKGSNYNGEYKVYWKSGGVKENYRYKKGVLDGYSATFFENGNKDEFMYYKEGQLHGEFLSYYNNGNLYAEGYYNNGEKVGEWKSYHANGALKKTLYYDNGNRIGHAVYYDLDGVKESDFDSRDGIIYNSKVYNPSGDKVCEVKTPAGTGDYTLTNIYGDKYLDGKLVGGEYHGKRFKYYPNGKIKEASTFVYGELHGEFMVYYPDGQVKRTGEFEYGSKTGPWKSYHHNGKLSWEGVYENDLVRDSLRRYFLTGELMEVDYFDKMGNLLSEKYFHTTGALMSHIPYDRDFIHGKYTVNDALGKVIISRDFNGGIETGYTYKKDGKLIETIPMSSKNEVKAYFDNGRPSFFYTYNNGLYEGEYSRFHSNGNKWIEGNYWKDSRDGERRNYYANGQLRIESNYTKGRLSGTYKYFNQKGVLLEEETYVDGNKEGVAKYYDDNGKLLYTLSYKDNVVVKID